MFSLHFQVTNFINCAKLAITYLHGRYNSESLSTVLVLLEDLNLVELGQMMKACIMRVI